MSYLVTFFKANGRDMVEIKLVGDPNSVIQKVTDDHRKQFPREWSAYANNDATIDWGGTPLTMLEASDGVRVSSSFATTMALKGIHNIEMLAELSDVAAKSLGMGIVTLRSKAQNYLAKHRNPGHAAKFDEPPTPRIPTDAEIREHLAKVEAEAAPPEPRPAARKPAKKRAAKPKAKKADA